jgi:hypothetical protein
MAIIDTLRLARALRDKAGFSQDAAEATAEALAGAVGDELATKADLGEVRADLGAVKTELKADIRVLENRIAEIERRMSDGFANVDRRFTVLTWAIGILAALEVVILSLLLRH